MTTPPAPDALTVSPDERVSRYADVICAAIDDDISEGVVPPGIGSFVDLHRYLDANEYLIDASVPYDGTQASLDLTNTVQNLVVARLRTPGRRFCTYGDCAFDAHDHTTVKSPDGADLDDAVPMRCQHCGQLAHYDARLEDYRHDDPAAPDCFLVHRDD
ncbi:hypothetical protein C1I95_19220 [Micromonospora craterilacus]|uniref:Uncharacterized protein n=1 Tax=Micromonospora craterilacus TaxID=1655439 RepID=A0A2W2EF64_9ACTN|nr:hypothetical protein [Micromonospora craterilacus]PZG15605.1 hypothetical protein C1I95_19220 [Micromonospora craterilacus]